MQREFALHDYPITEDAILRVGQDALDDMLDTIIPCGFNLGFTAIQGHEPTFEPVPAVCVTGAEGRKESFGRESDGGRRNGEP